METKDNSDLSSTKDEIIYEPIELCEDPDLPTPKISIEQFFKTELKVAVIEAADKLPKSKKLIKLQISLGDLDKRQIIAGIAQHYEAESLVGRKIVIVSNLEPAKLMGEESQGMLLAVTSGGKVTLIDPGQDSEPGSSVG